MNARLLLEIALRVFGLCFIFYLFSNLMSVLPFYLSNFSVGQVPNMPYIIGAIFGSFLLQMLLGGALVCWAPNIATWFYPPGSEGGELRTSVGPGDIYRTACFMLGAYLLVQTATPAAQLVIAGLRGNGETDQLIANSITTAASFVGGILLVFGSAKIADVLSNLRYDPDTIPNQRFSIAMLLVAITIIAIVLGIVRR